MLQEGKFRVLQICYSNGSYPYLTGLPPLTFSGGGTRAAASSYGVLEALLRIEIAGSSGDTIRLLDVITGVSGGAITAITAITAIA
jgi:hypothetical protein